MVRVLLNVEMVSGGKHSLFDFAIELFSDLGLLVHVNYRLYSKWVQYCCNQRVEFWTVLNTKIECSFLRVVFK